MRMRQASWVFSLLMVSACGSNGSSGPAPTRNTPYGTNGAPSLPPGPNADIKGYYRSPALRGDTLVFVAEGDLWQVARTGGVATRLTTDLAQEWSPAISPDGATLAYSAAYEGAGEVYTMPRGGGRPVRRTFHGADTRVVGFAPDGTLLYASRHGSTLPSTQLFRLNLTTGEDKPVPLAEAADGSFNADGTTLFFTRLPFQGSHTKRYQGGTAQQLWKYTTGAAEAVPLTADFPGTSKNPMWWSGRVYFLSDRDGTMNLWSMDEGGKDLKQLTKHNGWDAGQACLDPRDGRIAYRLGADLRIYDIASGTDAEVPITLASDFNQERETWVKRPWDYVSNVALSQHGDQVAITARGQVFVAPVKQGRLVEVTRKSGVRYRRAVFLPEKKGLVALSDESGEVELWRLAANGVDAPVELTKDGTILRWKAVPSPDGKLIAHTDKDHRLFLYDLEKGQSQLIATSKESDIGSTEWSPDSRFLAFTSDELNGMSRIRLYSVDDGKTTDVTTDRYDSWSPAWSPDGAWLYFLSDRNLSTFVHSPWGPRQPDPFVGAPTEIFAVALKRDARFPFNPVDEIHTEEAAKEAAKATAAEAAKKEKVHGKDRTSAVKHVEIDLDRLSERLSRVPVPAGRYRGLTTDGHRLYWLASDIAPNPKQKLEALTIGHDKPQVKTLLEDVRDYDLSGDRKKILALRERELLVFDAGDAGPSKLDEARVDLGHWTFSFDPQEEWLQMFIEAWRLERDYFYDRGMHGLDWPKVRDKYLPLVARVRSRDELSDLVAQMVSELSALHIFVGGGDIRYGETDIDVASFGAEWARDDAEHGYRITRIYQADPDHPEGLSPLQRNGVGVEVGDIVQAINGVDVLSVPDPASLLRNQEGKQVLVHVRPKTGLSHDVIVVPMSTREASNLRYDDWELGRRKRVEEQGKGDIGYVHLRAMTGADYAEWARDYYPVYRRAGLVIDVRHNRGGNIDSWILGKLLRRPWMFWEDRVSSPSWNMQYAFRGHIAVLTDGFTASDGEAFSEGIKRLKLGKVIGTRTWGGEIWLSSSNVLRDKGIATAAENGVYGPEGEWLIEGHGVDPDEIVDNLPHATFEGKDAQLDAAIQYLQERIAREPVKDIPPPPFPKKGVN